MLVEASPNFVLQAPSSQHLEALGSQSLMHGPLPRNLECLVISLFQHKLIPREKSRNVCGPVGIWCPALADYMLPSFQHREGRSLHLTYGETGAQRSSMPCTELPRDLRWSQDGNLHSLMSALDYESPPPFLCLPRILGNWL